MGRNEIRLRRQRMSTGRIARHRNYSELMRQHDRDTKLKRVLRVFYYFLVALFLVIILIIVIRWEKRSTEKTAGLTPSSIVGTAQFTLPLSRGEGR